MSRASSSVPGGYSGPPARLSGGVVTVTGSVEIRFADYSIERPASYLVLSIEDHGIMELQLHFRRG